MINKSYLTEYLNFHIIKYVKIVFSIISLVLLKVKPTLILITIKLPAFLLYFNVFLSSTENAVKYWKAMKRLTSMTGLLKIFECSASQ